MRKQNATEKRIESDEVQGAGSYVVLRRVRWRSMRAALGVFQQAGGEANASEAGLAMMEALLPAALQEWNWTDEDGQPLPLPADDPAVIDDLEPEEALWLVQQLSEMLPLSRKN